MNKILSIGLLLFLIGNVSVFAQAKTDAVLKTKDTLKSVDIDPLTPAKAAFYSAILPGLGQAYNKKYWKIPLVYGAMGTSLYFYIDNKKKYNEYRDAYKSRLAGNPDPNYNYLSDSQLIQAQEFYQRNYSLSGFFVIGFYVLNIIDANVDAALIQFNVNQNLSLKPEISPDSVTLKSNLGLTINYRF
ncbi:DUF5683 domain-containing protein [Flavobacterium gilvum]|uniref:DUF5683 domain-containing protein n=1 Tax=Flavobacterium gilvum TaxID=1492737 RepID=A0AAC9I186_9FLAO|nr:DUF5683 domain-containing protein [Flavobacterium gilvum]AOW08029.1 hypothetical protein EM308_00050 [Flavobacterium gilvum]KFC59420.1 hypothetical protein FEM08_17920 [Flavobacterium gilvum]